MNCGTGLGLQNTEWVNDFYLWKMKQSHKQELLRQIDSNSIRKLSQVRDEKKWNQIELEL